MATLTSSTGLNASTDHAEALRRNQIGSPADGRKLNGSGTPGTDINSGITASQNSEMRPVMVKDVDSTVIEGSHSSSSDDVSKDFSMESFKNQAGPRGKTGTEGA